MSTQKKIVSTLGFILTFTILFVFVRTELYRRTFINEYSSVIDEDSHFNVFFFGSSHMVNGISPIVLWKNYNITSYNFGKPGQEIPTSYFSMRMAVEQSRPDLVILDVYKVCNDHTDDIRDFFGPQEDAIPFSYYAPLSFQKIRLVASETPRSDYFYNLIPLSNYHYNWKYISEEDFWNVPSNYTMGYIQRELYTPTSFGDVKWNSMPRSTLKTLSSEYLNSFIRYCKDNNIDLLLVVLPYYAQPEHQAYLNTCRELAEAYDVPFYNMNDPQFIDFRTDFVDEYAGHLNALGAYKTSMILGQFLSANYMFESDTINPEDDLWSTAYKEYSDHQKISLKESTTLSNYLMHLCCIDASVEVTVYNSCILSDPKWSPFWSTLELYNTDNGSGSDDLTLIYKEPDSELCPDLHIVVYSQTSDEIIDNVYYSLDSGFSRPEYIDEEN